MSNYIKAKTWDGEDLSGEWEQSLKIDGIRALCRDGSVFTRNGEPVYGIDDIRHLLKEGHDYELYTGDFDESSAISRTKDNSLKFKPSDVYELYPTLDKRLVIGPWENPTTDGIKDELDKWVHNGYEGLIFRQGDTWLKVKPTETHDVKVLRALPGKGKHEGRMGALITEMGKVGTGFKDADRELGLENYVGMTIEVECLQLTKNGKFRLPRFKRFRYDK